MDPYQQQPTQQPNVPSNYLDTIAVQPTQPTMKPWLLWALIGGVILIAIIFVMALASGGTSSSERMQIMLWRMEAITTLADDSYKSIKSSELRTANSNLTTILTSAQQEGLAMLPENLQKQKQPKDSKLTAYFTELESTLEDARLNGDFDTPYAREITYQLGLLQSEIKYLQSGADGALATYLDKTSTDLESVATAFSEFDLPDTGPY